MADTPESHREQLAALFRGREQLFEQIKISQEMIEQSQELIRHIADVLAKSKA